MSLLNKGDILRSTADAYRIIDYLGEGLTARVYKAERLSATVNSGDYPVGSLVALKVLQEGLPDDIQRNFRDEADLIANLNHAERAAGLTKSLIPGLVERFTGADAAQEFLAMEFISGIPLDRRVREEGPLEELAALEVTAQVLTVLGLLHNQLHKTYTDFQLQNIWLLPDGQSIKIMDWNHVSRAREPLPDEWVDVDLRRMGAYLYQILTSKGAYQTGETGHSLAARAGERWGEISVGTRNIVRRALDPNDSRRFPHTAAFSRAVEEQLRLWRASVDDVVDEAQGYMRPVTKAYAEGAPLGQVDLEKAETWVDMAARLSPDDRLVKNWSETIQRVTQEVSGAWGSGRQLLMARQYQEAAAVWRAEATSWGRPDLWRRVMIAQTAVELGEATYLPIAQALEDAVNYMNREEWPAARELFAALPPAGSGSAALTSLRREVDAQLDYLAARAAYEDRRWADAGRGFREMERTLPAIAYAGILRETLGWDKLGELADESDRLAVEEQRNDARTSDLARVLANDLDAGLQEGKVALQEQPNSPAIIDLFEKEARRRPPAEAFRILATAQAFGVMPLDQEARLRDALAVARSQAKIEEALDGKRWAELASLVTVHPGAWPASATAQVHMAFNDAVSGVNTKLAGEIATLLDSIAPEGAEDRHLKLKDQQERQTAATTAWVKSLPAQIQTLLHAGEYAEARDLIVQAQPFLQDDSTIEGFLRRSQRQLDEFESIKHRLDEVKIKLEGNDIGLQDAERNIAPLKDRIGALSHDLSPESMGFLIHETNALTCMIFLKGAALELDEAGYLIDQRRHTEASEILDRVRTGLLGIPEQHPGRAATVSRLDAARARLDNELTGGDKRTWLERNAKVIVGGLGVLAILLIAGLIGSLLLASRDRDELAQTQASLATTEMEYAGSRSTVIALMTPSVADLTTAEALNSLSAQATTDANTLATYVAIGTRVASDNTELVEALATVQTTPEPLALASQLLDSIPISSTLGLGIPVFYDQPAALVIAPPPGWQFQIEPNQSLRITNGSGAFWNLQLNYGQIISDSVKSEVKAFVPSSAVSEDPQGSGGLRLDLPQIISGLWREPGQYRLNWEAIAADGLRTEGATPLYFEIAAPPTVRLIANGGFRSQPKWDAAVAVPRPTGDIVLEVLGKIDLPDTQTELGALPPVPDFLMVRLPGERTLYWMPSWNAVEYNTADWQALLDKLPVVAAPPEL